MEQYRYSLIGQSSRPILVVEDNNLTSAIIQFENRLKEYLHLKHSFAGHAVVESYKQGYFLIEWTPYEVIPS